MSSTFATRLKEVMKYKTEWFSEYLMTVFQLQRLCNIEYDGENDYEL
jgi:hypothetical protein